MKKMKQETSREWRKLPAGNGSSHKDQPQAPGENPLGYKTALTWTQAGFRTTTKMEKFKGTKL